MAEIHMPNIIAVGRRLSGLENTPRVLHAFEDPELRDQFEHTIYNGLNELVLCFNRITPEDMEYAVLPGVQALKEKLHGRQLPRVEDISARMFSEGLHEAVPRIEMGQKVRRNPETFSPEERNAAIGTPSMSTTEYALAVGTAAHLFERSVMAYMQKEGIHDWQKDDILFALEEIALFMHVQAEIAEDSKYFPDPLLYPFIVLPNDQGGLGWRNEKDILNLRAHIAAYTPNTDISDLLNF